MPVGAQNDTVLIPRQSKLESVKENIISKFMLCAAATAFRQVADGSVPTAAESGARLVHDGQFPSVDGSRYNEVATELFRKP
jgi:hypothetical protein